MKLEVYTDGGARGNPGPSACGIVIFHNDKLIDFDAFYVGHTTNNQAEYLALRKGVEIVCKLRPESVKFYLDSELVVNQMKGEYKIKNNELKNHAEGIFGMLDCIKHYSFHHVPRKDNKFADKLVNIILDAVK